MLSIRRLAGRYDLTSWQVEIARRLEDAHLVAWCREAGVRDVFAIGLERYLETFPDTQVCCLRGDRIVDLDSFCEQLEAALPGGRLEPRIDGDSGILARLRRRNTPPGSAPARSRYLIWRDAHVLLRHDPDLFGVLADAIAGVAAEGEFVTEDMLLLQRATFIGSAALDMYASDPRGQFRSWRTETPERALWSVVTGLDAPPMRTMEITRDLMSLPAPPL